MKYPAASKIKSRAAAIAILLFVGALLQIPSTPSASAALPNPMPQIGKLTFYTAQGQLVIKRRWGCTSTRKVCVRIIEGYSKLHGGGVKSDHAKGKAVDAMVSKMGTRPNAAHKAMGDQIANYFVKNYASLRVNYVIWNGRIWSVQKKSLGWRPYKNQYGSSITHRHIDHVHISFSQ